MARSSNNRSIKAAMKPYKKESTYTNVFSFPVLLWVFGYVCFNFWMEWQNWDKLLKKSSAPPPQKPNASTYERWTTVDVDNNAAIGVLRLEQVCDKLDILDGIFLCMCVLVPLLSIARFVLRQEKILHETLKCENGLQWFAGFVFLAGMRAIEAFVAFLLISMILPSSFFMCYRLVAMYFCTLTFATFIGFIVCIIITSAVSQSVLVFDVNYTSLGVVGKDQEIDIIETKRRRIRSAKKSRSAKKFRDTEAEALMEEDEAYTDQPSTDQLDTDEETYVDEVV